MRAAKARHALLPPRQPGQRHRHHERCGAVIERLAYEPFGKRRFPNGTADPNNTLIGVTTERSFTDHEYLDELA